MRILVAEDDDRTANYLVRGLIESGHIVDRVADGETALAMALEGIYEALVLDRMLPAMDGVTLVRRLREHDRSRGGNAGWVRRLPRQALHVRGASGAP